MHHAAIVGQRAPPVGAAGSRGDDFNDGNGLLSAAGSFMVGLLADRLNVRLVMAIACVSAAAGIVALLGAVRVGALVACTVLFGAVSGTPAVLMTLVIADSLGVRRLGLMLGVEGIFATIGFAAGPIIAGRIYDVTHSYSDALWLFIALSVVSAAAILVCRPLAQEQSRRAVAAAVSAA
jgi:MFS family permease